MNRRTLIEDLFLCCNRCGHHCQDGRDLIRHKWEAHGVSTPHAVPIYQSSLAFVDVGHRWQLPRQGRR